MPSWTRDNLDGMPLYRAALLAQQPGVSHGFTTRQGGVSAAPFDTLNFSTRLGDTAEAVQENERRLWRCFDAAEGQVARAQQVHGNRVAVVTQGGLAPEADALVTSTPGLFLMLLFADCVPVYFVDPVRRVVALAHAGWRGAASGVVAETMAVLTAQFGSDPADCLAAIGPCIHGYSYEVGSEVAEAFRAAVGEDCAVTELVQWPGDEAAGKYHLNLRQVLFNQLLKQNVPPQNIAVCSEDTYRNATDFFSHRRDQGATGRMAGFLMLRA